jgi:hypothetical protein
MRRTGPHAADPPPPPLLLPPSFRPLQIGQRHMADPSGPLGILDMMYAGTADPAARATMAAVISAVGFHPVYVGPIRYSRNLESIAELVSRGGRPSAAAGKWGVMEQLRGSERLATRKPCPPCAVDPFELLQDGGRGQP